MEVEVKNIKGDIVKKITLDDRIFGIEMKEGVLHSVVKSYQANRRQGTHATKTRAFVSGGGKKPFKQKGRGTARQGSSRSPLQPGGATSHGPQPRDYRQETNKKSRRLALKIALSDKLRHSHLVVVDDFNISSYSTKHVVDVMNTLKVSKALLADERKDDLLHKSTRNINKAQAMSASEINAELVLRYDYLVISENGLNALGQRLQEKSDASS